MSDVQGGKYTGETREQGVEVDARGDGTRSRFSDGRKNRTDLSGSKEYIQRKELRQRCLSEKLYDIPKGKGHDHDAEHELDDFLRDKFLESCSNIHTCKPTGAEEKSQQPVR
jgi:hypothetical protein